MLPTHFVQKYYTCMIHIHNMSLYSNILYVCTTWDLLVEEYVSVFMSTLALCYWVSVHATYLQCSQYWQHEYCGTDHRLWAVWLPGQVWSRAHLQWIRSVVTTATCTRVCITHVAMSVPMQAHSCVHVHADNGGRYAYDRQPAICRWNLEKLAEALSSCLSEEGAQDGLALWGDTHACMINVL